MVSLRASCAILSSLVLAASAGCAAEAIEGSAEASDAIVGGRGTTAAPAVGYIAHGLQVDGKWLAVLPFCTGTLIAPDIVLTAAHCIERAKELGYTPHFGTEDPRRPGVLVSVKEAVMNPAFVRDRRWSSDLAYLVLETPIRDAGLGKPSSAPHAAGCEYVALGYGSKKEGHKLGSVSSDADLGYRKALPMCADDGYNATSISPVTNLTISAHGAEGSPCEGDSGGPLLVEGTSDFIGVLSNVGEARLAPTCSKNARNYYAPVALNKEFIRLALSKSRATP